MVRRQRAEPGVERIQYCVRFTAEQRRLLVAEADAAGVTVPYLVVMTTMEALTRRDRFSFGRRQVVTRGLKELSGELRRIGVNVNQIARAANTFGQLPEGNAAAMRALFEVTDRVNALLSQLDGAR